MRAATATSDLVPIGMTSATCCAGNGDSAGAGGKESASATKWRSLGTTLSDLAMLAIPSITVIFSSAAAATRGFYG